MKQRFAYAREYVAKEAELQKIFGSILAVKDKVAELSIEVDSEKCVARTDFHERARIRKEKFEWGEVAAPRVWCCGPETEGSQCGCKTTKRKAKDPHLQTVVEGNNTLVVAPRKYDRFQAAEAHLPDGVVKEEIRERVANKTKQLEAKRRMLAELEVATLVAARALKKGKAAAVAAAAVAEEC